ncbi:hypothetical protein ABZ754_27740 [Micromonospora purpureochromogenes]|uniref:hypothetical protein n=1 Tax=Micromonospora purpureochromogenes TaxID=47872 RepID=UPI0033DA3F4A
MSWWRERWRRRKPPENVAELLTSTGPFRVAGEQVELGDRETVRRWLRELDPDLGQQVFVHRPWGTVAAVSDHRDPVAVVMSDAEGRPWAAYVPGADHREHLTPEQVESVMLAALTSDGPPAGPDWRRLD